MEIRSNACEGKLNVELYSDDGYYLYTLPYTEEGWQIPDWLMEEQYEQTTNKLRKIVEKQDEEIDEEEIDDQLAVQMNRRAMGDIKMPHAHYIQPSDPASRVKLTPDRPPKPKMFLGKPQEEHYTDPRKVKTPPSVVKDLAKGIVSNLLGIGAIVSMLPNKEQERMDRLMERELDRVERIRDKNNKRK